MTTPDTNSRNGKHEFTAIEMKITPKEREVFSVVREYEVPLLKAAWETWSGQILPDGRKREWLVCGPATIALSRVINWETGIPILKDGDPNTQEHLHLPTLYYIPDRENLDDSTDHVPLAYFNGQGSVTHIDATGPLTYGGKKGLTGKDDLRGAIHMRTVSTEDYDNILTSEYHLYPFNPTDSQIRAEYTKRGFRPRNADDLAVWKSVIHDDRITSSYPLIDSGRELIIDDHPDRYGLELATFIRELVPDWTGIKNTGGDIFISSPDH